VLRLVGLGDTGHKKTGQFSLGMKQRLAIAVALLHSPQLLILDEPTNGLDPHGMVEMRELLKALNQQQGITLLISSHLLAEIEKLVTDVGIIHRGQLLFEGSLQALHQKQQEASSLVFVVNDPTAALALIQPVFPSVRAESDRILLPSLAQTDIARLNQQFVNQGIDVYGIQTTQSDLESIFMTMTND
jgi:ABC-2 type transport system ATP-binding protein